MTELEKAVLEPELETEEILPEPEEDESEKKLSESKAEVERLKQEMAEESKQLDMRFAEIKLSSQEKPQPRRRYFYIGTFSAALSLIMMGVAMTMSLFSPTGVLTAFKIAPLMLVFLGLEIGFAIFRNRTARLRYNVKSIVLTIFLVVVTGVMSIISVNNSVTGGERYYAEERLENMLNREISHAMPLDNVKNVDIKIHLYGDDPAVYETIKDLEDSDVIDLEITYIDAQMTMHEYAQNCRRIMDVLSTMPYNFGIVSFTANDDINSYRMEINWLYQSDFSTTELVPLINYFGNNIVMDIPDLIDE